MEDMETRIKETVRLLKPADAPKPDDGKKRIFSNDEVPAMLRAVRGDDVVNADLVACALVQKAMRGDFKAYSEVMKLLADEK